MKRSKLAKEILGRNVVRKLVKSISHKFFFNDFCLLFCLFTLYLLTFQVPSDDDSAEREEFLQERLNVPTSWIAEAKATRASRDGNYGDQVNIHSSEIRGLRSTYCPRETIDQVYVDIDQGIHKVII